MARSAAEIKEELENSGFFENKFCFNIHNDKFKDYKPLTREQQDDIAEWVRVNALGTRDALYIGQGVSIGLNIEQGYEYFLDYDKPPHPLFIQKQSKRKLKKKTKGLHNEKPVPQYKYR